MGGDHSDSEQCLSLKSRWLEAEVSLVGFQSSVPFSSCSLHRGDRLTCWWLEPNTLVGSSEGKPVGLLESLGDVAEESTGFCVVLSADTFHPCLVAAGLIVG